jgi:hypothetical protein
MPIDAVEANEGHERLVHFIAFADALAACNRYSYVVNNPLSATDPTGYLLKQLWWNKSFRLLVSIAVAAYICYGDFSWIGSASGLTSNAAANAFIGEFVSCAINSGTLEGAAIGGLGGPAGRRLRSGGAPV